MTSRTFELTVTVDAEEDDADGLAALPITAIKRTVAAALTEELEPLQDESTGVCYFVTAVR
ncbi:hypothetical protein [Microlunatus soli]|uniref:Uncharacterized protein n=1 Tax=Microlunatus soli TaxID=630515 RepID=A0A1H1SH19_9ACTN|nr:hypothetical protein [Microlunatus soli]SDS47153.1 hypothetical protein SAMN04489812_2008 [Microlunatus soli]